MKICKRYTKWANLIDSKVLSQNAPFTEKEVIYLRAAINGSSSMSQSLKDLLFDLFVDKMPKGGYSIMLDHEKKGISYLKKNTFKLNGSLRKNNIFGQFELDIINDFSHFKFVGLKNCSQNSYDYFLPIYRCIGNGGQYFEYTGTMYSQIQILSIGSLNLTVVPKREVV